MASQTLLAKYGLRLAAVGSAAVLAVAAPVANGGPTVAGNQDMSSHTAANRTGMWFDQSGGAEQANFVVGGQTGPSFQRSGTDVNVAVTGNVSATKQLVSTVATGTAPLSVASTTVVPNLNASQLLGSTWAIPAALGSGTPNTGAFTTVAASGVITSTLATGTAPFTVASTTMVSNLYVARAALADSSTSIPNLTGPITSVGTATSIASQTGTGTKFVVDNSPTLITPNIGAATGTSLSVSGQLTSTVATGTAPLVVSSTTVVTNLHAANSDQLLGGTWAIPGAIGATTPNTGAFTAGTYSGQITSTVLSGTAPFIVASTTVVGNLNASLLLGGTWAIPGAIGATTPNTGVFTTGTYSGQITSTVLSGTAPFIVASTTVVGNLNASLLLGGTWAIPGAIGATTPSTGAFTTVSVTGQITSTLATGTAPFVIASTTLVSNLYVARAALADTATTNANLTGPITSVGNATSIASQTGTGTKFVVDTSPTLVTPVIGAATGTSLSVSGQLTSTVATGTAPLVVSSTTVVANLHAANSDQLLGGTWAIPGTIGSTTPNTGAFTTLAASGIASLNGGLQLQNTTFSNADTTITSARVISAQTGTMSAARLANLPAANAVVAGTVFWVVDYSGSVTTTNTISITPAGADTINGGASYAVSQSYGAVQVVSDGTSKWTVITGSSLPALSASKWLFNNGTTSSWQTITTSDVSGLGSMATQSANAVAITGGTLSGITSLAAAVTSTVTSGTVNLLSSIITANPGGASTGIYENVLSSNTSGSNAQNLTSATAGLVALSATITHAGTGVITGADCIQVQGTTSGASGTITTLRGVHVLNATKGGGTTITTQVGLEVDSISSGTTNFAIRTGTGLVKLQDTTDATSGGTGSLFTAGGIGITKALYVGSTITGAGNGTITTSAPALSLTQTWNAGGVTFTGIFANITSTASAAGSLLIDLQVGSASQFSVAKDGTLLSGAGADTINQIAYCKLGTVPSGTSTGMYLGNSAVFTTSGYAIVQNASGDTTLNSNTGRSLRLAIGNSVKLTLTSTTYTVASLTLLTPPATAGGAVIALTVTGAANTNQASTSEVPDISVNLSRTVTWLAGTIVAQRFVKITAPTIAFASASTCTTSATVAIAGPPVAGSNATLTVALALWVEAGYTRFDGRQLLNAPNSAPTDADIPTSAVSWYLDEAGNNIKVRVRYSDGTTLKTGTVALV